MHAGVYGAEGSGWHEAYQAGKPTLDRAQAMLADLIGRRGPDEYKQALIHIVPQSFGLVHVGGGSIERLSAVGAMEELDDAWREVQSLMAVDSPTAIEDHVNPQAGRREGTQEDIEREMGGMRDRILRAVEAHAAFEAAPPLLRQALVAEAANASAAAAVFPHALALTRLSSEEDRQSLRALATAALEALAPARAGASVSLVHALDSRRSWFANAVGPA